MELTQHGILEELLAPRRESWNPLPPEITEFFPNGWSFDTFEENPILAAPNPTFSRFVAPTEPNFDCALTEAYPFVGGFTVPEMDSYTKNATPAFPIQEEYPAMVEDEDISIFNSSNHQCFEEGKNSCKVEMEQSTDVSVSALNMGLCGEKKKSKKLEGQPSKNLMAERRRRKRLNDRLSMLRSIVPKISKMDRTSILGDTIDYMKELIEKINKLQEEEELEVRSNNLNQMSNFKELKPNEHLVRNSPKFDVERRDSDTRIDICCAAKPGLLLSTVNTIEALGLEIQQCVISCFNDFAMQASCSEGNEQRSIVNSEDIKQALFRNAGYGGRCL